MFTFFLHFLQEEGLHETNSLMENEDARAEVKLRTTLEELASTCQKYVAITKNSQTGCGTGKTKLDKERMKLCEREIVMHDSFASCDTILTVFLFSSFKGSHREYGKKSACIGY